MIFHFQFTLQRNCYMVWLPHICTSQDLVWDLTSGLWSSKYLTMLLWVYRVCATYKLVWNVLYRFIHRIRIFPCMYSSLQDCPFQILWLPRAPWTNPLSRKNFSWSFNHLCQHRGTLWMKILSRCEWHRTFS